MTGVLDGLQMQQLSSSFKYKKTCCYVTVQQKLTNEVTRSPGESVAVHLLRSY